MNREQAEKAAREIAERGIWEMGLASQRIVADILQPLCEQEIALVKLADKVVEFTGHSSMCQFSRCSCGAVDKLKIARSEYLKLRRQADIIERACGQGADSEKVGNNFLTPKLKALDLYYAQKDGCPNGHPSGAGKICVDCVAQALAERSCEHDGIESVLLMFYRHIDRFGVDPKDRTEQSQSQVRCFDAYWKLKTEERSCGETACPHCQCTCFQCRNCARPSPPTGRTEEK